MGERGHGNIRLLDFEDIFYKLFYKSCNVLKYNTFTFSCQPSSFNYFPFAISLILKISKTELRIAKFGLFLLIYAIKKLINEMEGNSDRRALLFIPADF